MFKCNSDITDTRSKPGNTADKQSAKIHLLFCIHYRGNNTQATTNNKIQMENNKI